MLQTDEVDDDFFTPVAGTSLANIFGFIPKTTEGKANDSLKYVPSKPQNIVPKPEPTKTTECIFACALIGHEWFNNVYTSRGKLGFAIIKMQKSGGHNIILYDSNKTTLSYATISTNLEITIKNKTYISYYDNLSKYWSLYGTEEEVKKVVDHLTNFAVNIKNSTYTEQGPPEPNDVDIKTESTLENRDNNDKESDTDSSINRKTKASILNRMAHMGHSVLPTPAIPVDRTSDSSDTMESDTQPKTVRHKLVKSVMKRNNIENVISESQQIVEPHQRINITKTEPIGNLPVYTSHSGQLLPLTSSNIITGPSNEMGVYISEQRISNSELRINMNRLTDKVDIVLDKISHLEQKGTMSVQTDILMKLLAEYENKIKVYEELMKSRGDKNFIGNVSTLERSSNYIEIELLKNKISEFEKVNLEKSNEVANLQDEIRLLKNKFSEQTLDHTNNKDELQGKIRNLENKLQEKDEKLETMTKKCESLSANILNASSDNIGHKVKNIMNDTFQTISVNFDNSENYSGETVKKIIAAVIKTITIQTLRELDND